MADLRAVEIREDSIRLGQFLKLAGLVGSGSDVKLLTADRQVRVNGELEDRRGRRLYPGDTVTVGTEILVVGTQGDA